jgi:hypothetical protein
MGIDTFTSLCSTCQHRIPFRHGRGLPSLQLIYHHLKEDATYGEEISIPAARVDSVSFILHI